MVQHTERINRGVHVPQPQDGDAELEHDRVVEAVELAEGEAQKPVSRKKTKAKGKTKTPVEVVDKNGKGITALVPAKRTTTHALDVGPMTVAISIAMNNGATYSMNLADAKYIYAQLNQIFGAAR